MLTTASTAAISILSTSMAVGIGKYLRSKTRSRRCGKYAVDATAAVDAVWEAKIRGRRGILEVDAVDAVFSQTAEIPYLDEQVKLVFKHHFST